jgi:hypothetical protein
MLGAYACTGRRRSASAAVLRPGHDADGQGAQRPGGGGLVLALVTDESEEPVKAFLIGG